MGVKGALSSSSPAPESQKGFPETRGVGWPAVATPATQEPHRRALRGGRAGVQRRDWGLALSEAGPTARSLPRRWAPTRHTPVPILPPFPPGGEPSPHQGKFIVKLNTWSYSAAPPAPFLYLCEYDPPGMGESTPGLSHSLGSLVSFLSLI